MDVVDNLLYERPIQRYTYQPNWFSRKTMVCHLITRLKLFIGFKSMSRWQAGKTHFRNAKSWHMYRYQTTPDCKHLFSIMSQRTYLQHIHSSEKIWPTTILCFPPTSLFPRHATWCDTLDIKIRNALLLPVVIIGKPPSVDSGSEADEAEQRTTFQPEATRWRRWRRRRRYSLKKT